MKYFLLVLLISTLAFACSESTEKSDADEVVIEDLYEKVMSEGPEQLDEDQLREEVGKFNSDHEKIAFLKKIMTEDQRVRSEETEANQQYGYHSQEHKQALARMMEMDAQNLQRIDVFTEIYGAPELNSVGRVQSDAIWLVVHHSPGTDAHERYFQMLYNSWKQEMIDGTAFSFYLNRWYEKVSGERHMMEGAYTDKEEVETLIRLLELEPEG